MTDDLGMDSNQYSIALIVFFITVGPSERLSRFYRGTCTGTDGSSQHQYVIFEVPSNLILARTKPSIFLPTIMFLWVSEAAVVSLSKLQLISKGRCDLLHGSHQDIRPAGRTQDPGRSPRSGFCSRHPADSVIVVQEGRTIEALRCLHIRCSALGRIRRHHRGSDHWVCFLSPISLGKD